MQHGITITLGKTYCSPLCYANSLPLPRLCNKYTHSPRVILTSMECKSDPVNQLSFL